MESSGSSRRLSWPQKISYSIGHVFNDLAAAFWFTYLLIFMHSVNRFSSNTSGILMLIGQIADGLATPFVGIECDRNLDWWICRYGRRKAWHLVGTVCTLISFPFLFMKCFIAPESSENSQLVYYAAFIVIFQFGWASVQISHLSLIPALTPVSSERIELNAYRYAFTVFATITVYGLMYIFLSGTDQVGPGDAGAFRTVALIIIALGTLFSLGFHFGVRERPAACQSENGDSAEQESQGWLSWLKKIEFYKVALLYMGTRLTINLTQVYIPNYLQETLYLEKKSIALIPLVTYVSGFLTSFLMKYISKKLGKKMTFFVGTWLSMGACIWIYYGQDDTFKKYLIYGVSVLIGVSNSIMLITSLGITNDLIGQNTVSGAFVFGAMSFVDKTSNGIAVAIIEHFKPCSENSCIVCDYYYRDVLTFVCGGSTAIAIVSLAFLSTGKKLGGSKNANENQQQQEEEEVQPGNSLETGTTITTRKRPTTALDNETITDTTPLLISDDP